MSLYGDLAKVYEAMYQTFINYKEEYIFYSDILKKYKKNNLLEIGSGTGHLAEYFTANDFEYTGLDLSEEMIEIAQLKMPQGKFLKGDMRQFKLEKQVESVLITGRTISYLVKNSDVNATFESINQNLNTGGIVCFDFIDAREFIPFIGKGQPITHEAAFDGMEYLRKSHWSLVLENGMDFKWESTYFKKTDNKWIELGQDNSIVRTFTINELEIFLELNQFKVKEIIAKKAYAFPTYVIVAEKIN